MTFPPIKSLRHRGRGRAWFGFTLCAVALGWLAEKLGWLGAGSGGLFWPLLAAAAGLVVALGGRRRHAPPHRQRVPGGGS